MGEWRQVGSHRYLVTGDLLFWRPNGEILPEHAEAACSLLGQLIARYGYALWLIDAEHSVAIGSASRQVYARRLMQEHSRVAMASFHAKRPAQTSAVLIVRGIELMGQGTLLHQTCEAEAEARTYLAQRREAWTAAKEE
jgi:hypothetical protein